MTGATSDARGRGRAARKGAIALASLAGLSLGAAHAQATPSITELGVVSGQRTVVTWRSGGAALTSAEVQVNLDAAGGVSGAWVTYANAPTSPGVQTVTMDLRGFVGDGRHQVRLVARDAGGETTTVGPYPATVDTTPPSVAPPVFGALVGGTFLPVTVSATDSLTGIDLLAPVELEVAPFDRENKVPAGAWHVAGPIQTTENGVGVDLSAWPDDEYLGRVKLSNVFGLVARSAPTWFAKVPEAVPAPPPPPTKLLLRFRSTGGFVAKPGVRYAAQRRPFLLSGQLRGPVGEVLAGYRVTVRMADGRGFALTTDERGRFSLAPRTSHGGVVKIRASRNGSILKHDLTVRLLGKTVSR